MQHSESFTKFVRAIAEPWAIQMAYEMGAESEGSLLGKVLMSVGEPFSFTVGVGVAMVEKSEEIGRNLALMTVE